jgi:hypothetical protein
MSAAFSQALVRGLGAHLPATSATSSGVMPYSGAKASSTSRGYIAQKTGDPNYYATTPKFDSRGFWQAAGSNQPREPPSGSPATPPQGEWVQQGTTIRNGQTTAFWVWYPPKDKQVTFGSHRTGEHNYLVSRTKPIGSAKQLFIIPPEYWVHEYVVAPPPSPPKSSYHPQSLEYDTVEQIVPVVGTFRCQRWLLVATQWVDRLNATLGNLGMFHPKAVFDYYVSNVGVSPYFTWNGYLFKFEYTGYDAKTGKYRHGSQYKNIISICTDGLNVQKNPPGDASNYTVFAPGGSGGVSVVHRRGTHGVGLGPKENSMKSAFSPALVRGLGAVIGGDGAVSAGTMPYSGQKASSMSHGYIAQKTGDPNYYATEPKFDSRGFWHSAGTMAPIGFRSSGGQAGQWVKQGQVERNSLSTNFWVWYPTDIAVLAKAGQYMYVVARDKKSLGTWKVCNDAIKVFQSPEYWVKVCPTEGLVPAGVVGTAGLRGLGQLIDGATLQALNPASVPPVYVSDWIEFYPNDPNNYQGNTNLGFGALPQQGYGLINQINSSAPGTTTYWLLIDPNSGAAWTVSTLGSGVALIRSSYSGGKLKLEIARMTVPVTMKMVSGASLPKTLPANPLWESTGVAATSGKTVALSPAKQAQQANYYLQYLQQPQFNDGVPSAGASWSGWEPVPVPTSYPNAYFSYGGQYYQLRPDGSVYVDVRSLVLKPLPFPVPVSPRPVPGTSPVTSPVLPHMPLPVPSTPPAWTRPIAVSGPLPPAMTPPWAQPVTLPSGVQSAAAAALQASQAVSVPTLSPAAVTSNIPPAAAIAMGLIGAGILGGVLYLVFE